jgi:hypothetical protein
MHAYTRLITKYRQDKFHLHFAFVHGYAALLAGAAVVMHLLAVAYHLQMHRGAHDV